MWRPRGRRADVWTDTKLYFTAPLRWDTADWLYQHSIPSELAADLVDAGAIRLECPARNKRPHERPLIKRIANPNAGVRAHQPFHEPIRDSASQDQPPRARAPLPGSANRAKHDGTQGQVEIRIVEHGDGVVATQFKDRPPGPAANHFGDTLAHGSSGQPHFLFSARILFNF